MTRPDGAHGKAIDAAVLDQILDIGDAQLRRALLDQLLTDFHRLAEALDDHTSSRIGAAAHELKGLAATIGAERLATLAQRLNAVADDAITAELGPACAPVRGEIRVVLDSLTSYAGRVRS